MLDHLHTLIPPYAQDISANLTAIEADKTLSDQQKWGVMLACAHNIGVSSVLAVIESAARKILSPEAVRAAQSASAIMAMNTVYYRALHVMVNEEYRDLPSKLRMNILRNPGIDKLDFELFCVAVAAVNGCGACLDAHEKVLRDHGASDIMVQTALRIAAVMTAVSVVIRAEDVL